MAGKKKINDPQIEKIVNNAIKTGAWHMENTKNHPKLRHVPSGRMVPVGTTVSDWRASKNLERDIRHVECGLPQWGMREGATC